MESKLLSGKRPREKGKKMKTSTQYFTLAGTIFAVGVGFFLVGYYWGSVGINVCGIMAFLRGVTVAGRGE